MNIYEVPNKKPPTSGFFLKREHLNDVIWKKLSPGIWGKGIEPHPQCESGKEGVARWGSFRAYEWES